MCATRFSRKTFNVPTEGPNDVKYINKQNRPWFDEECQTLRDRFYRELNKYREDNNNTTEIHVINARSNFKNVLRKKTIYI